MDRVEIEWDPIPTGSMDVFQLLIPVRVAIEEIKVNLFLGMFITNDKYHPYSGLYSVHKAYRLTGEKNI